MNKENWTIEKAKSIYNLPFPDLIFRAQVVHRENFSATRVQKSTLLSIKTGGCSEDCSYCPQSVHHDTGLERHKLLSKEDVLAKAKEAQDSGSSRFCMGAAWRQVKDGDDFDNIIDIVSAVSDTGLEVCCTLGMLNADQAKRLKSAGCYAYNHNLDTSPEYYGEVISTRNYQDRLNTIQNVRDAGITVCCGGIVGLGESVNDRLGLLVQLASQDPHPESVPINMLVRVEGTPLEHMEKVDSIEFVRIIATARIMMPNSMVRLSAGRLEMSDEMQALCYLAGANSIFAGEKLLTTPNPSADKDKDIIEKLGMTFMTPDETPRNGACGNETARSQSPSDIEQASGTGS